MAGSKGQRCRHRVDAAACVACHPDVIVIAVTCSRCHAKRTFSMNVGAGVITTKNITFVCADCTRRSATQDEQRIAA